MSGAEGLAVLGIIVNIMTLADLSARALSRVKEYSDKADALPGSFREVESILPLVAGTLGRAKERAESEPCDETLKQLRPVFERCEKKMSQLKVIFDAALAREGASTLERGWKALKSMRKDEEVQQIAQGLHNFIALLAQRHIFATATSKEVAGLAEGMQVIALSQPVAAKPKTYFMVPVRWNDDFVGRTEILAALESKLCKGNYCRVALVGLGGMG
jgi:hypothetical protein